MRAATFIGSRAERMRRSVTLAAAVATAALMVPAFAPASALAAKVYSNFLYAVPGQMHGGSTAVLDENEGQGQTYTSCVDEKTGSGGWYSSWNCSPNGESEIDILGGVSLTPYVKNGSSGNADYD